MKVIYTLLTFVMLSTISLQAQKPDFQVIEQFQVVGISVRTTNAHGQAMKDIEALWTRFWGEEIKNKVPNKISDDIYALYTNYESNYTGAYTMIIGMPVSSLGSIPAGFEGITIPKATYQKFVSKGKMPEAVVNTWIDIWQKDDSLDRAYQTDFTVHGKKYFAGDKAEVATFISINLQSQ